METSALKNFNIETAFKEMTEKIFAYNKPKPKLAHDSTINLNVDKKISNSRKSCCF